MRTFKFILETLKPFKLLVLGFFFTGIIWAIDLSLRPYILKIMINKISNIQEKSDIDDLWWIVILYTAASVIVIFIWRVQEYIWLKLNPFLKRHIIDLLMRHMMHQSLGVFHNHFAGNLASKIKDIASGIPDLLRLFINNFFGNFLGVIIAIFTVSMINYSFSLLMTAWLLIFISGSIFFSKRGKNLAEFSAETKSKAVGQMVDILSNILTVHLFARKKEESRHLKTFLDAYVQADQRRDWWFLIMFCFHGLSFIVYQFLSFVLLMQGLKKGTVTVGDFALLISINISIIDILWSLAKDVFYFSELMGNINQGLKIILEPIEIQDKNHAKNLKITSGQIVFDNVKFHYKGIDPLFNNKSVIIEKAQKVGLVGYSGGGKSTFVNLILRLYELTEGSIFIDGQNIKDVTQDSLHEAISMIPQDPTLFHRSLMDNIRYGRIDATDEEVIVAAQKAYIHEFIMTLPDRYQTLVGERGVKLSGGQRQRVAIARAILKNAPILILDEATSQLDSLTEVDIQNSLDELMNGKTTIIIAHRLSTLLHMDRILVFENGKIIEDGTHQELLVKNGLYKTLWDAQIGGFLQDQKQGK